MSAVIAASFCVPPCGKNWLSIFRCLRSTPIFLVALSQYVVEILSPSNTAAEIQDKKEICLENGTVEFWVVDPKRHQVKVSDREGRTNLYKAGQQISLFFGSIAVDAIFG